MRLFDYEKICLSSVLSDVVDQKVSIQHLNFYQYIWKGSASGSIQSKTQPYLWEATREALTREGLNSAQKCLQKRVNIKNIFFLQISTQLAQMQSVDYQNEIKQK